MTEVETRKKLYKRSALPFGLYAKIYVRVLLCILICLTAYRPISYLWRFSEGVDSTPDGMSSIFLAIRRTASFGFDSLFALLLYPATHTVLYCVALFLSFRNLNHLAYHLKITLVLQALGGIAVGVDIQGIPWDVFFIFPTLYLIYLLSTIRVDSSDLS